MVKIPIICLQCKKEFLVYPSVAKTKKLCSWDCKNKYCSAKARAKYDGRFSFDVAGYIIIVKYGHPLADSRGRILYHRYVMWEAGLLINPDDVVHHIDGNKKNNEIINLKVMTQSEHIKIHKPVEHRTIYETKGGWRLKRNTNGD